MVTTIKIAQYDDDKGLAIRGAIAEANNRKLRILSNMEIDQRLQDGTWKSETEMYPCWTGTFIAYEKPGTPLGKTLESNNFTLQVPKRFQGKVDVAIVCNHPDFTLKDDVFTLGKSAKAIPFPRKDGWYLPDKEFGIPNGANDGSQNTRHLWRCEDDDYVGLVSRYGRWFGYGRRGVCCDYWSSDGRRRGVFGEGRKGKMPKHKHEWECTICGEKR